MGYFDLWLWFWFFGECLKLDPEAKESLFPEGSDLESVQSDCDIEVGLKTHLEFILKVVGNVIQTIFTDDKDCQKTVIEPAFSHKNV